MIMLPACFFTLEFTSPEGWAGGHQQSAAVLISDLLADPNQTVIEECNAI